MGPVCLKEVFAIHGSHCTVICFITYDFSLLSTAIHHLWSGVLDPIQAQGAAAKSRG